MKLKLYALKKKKKNVFWAKRRNILMSKVRKEQYSGGILGQKKHTWKYKENHSNFKLQTYFMSK